MASADPPTSYPEVNETLRALLNGARDVLGDRFIGLYLYGSLAGGGFDPARSDIDFAVVTDGPLDAETVAALEAMHSRLWASGLKWAAKLEGAYLPRDLLRRHDPAEPPCAYVNEGRFSVGPLGGDWVIQRHMLREHGLAVAGPDLRPLIDPVTPGDLRRCARETLRDWWEPMLEQPDPRLAGGEYQSYAILSMCRTLHTLETGVIGSKQAAARWAQETLPAQWQPLIAWADAWRPGAAGDRFGQALDFIRYSVETTSLRIRPMTPEDWPTARAIYREGISTGDATFQTEAPEWEAWDAAHLAACRLIALQDNRAVSWAALSPVSSRPIYAGVMEVSIYVAADRRGQGVGTRLLAALIAASERAGIWTLQAGIFPENEASLALHLRCGFRVVGRRERLGQMSGRWRDVILLERRSALTGADDVI